MALSTSCLPRKIVVGERAVRLNPPTVRQAVEILHVLEHMEGPEDEQLLFELLGGLEWSGAADIVILLRNFSEGSPLRFGRFLREILLQGYDPEEQTRRSKKGEGVPEEADWKLLLSEYCRAYPGRDPFEVYDEVPFPFFMEMLPEARREIARRHIYRALETGVGFGGGKDLMKQWQGQAGWLKSQADKVKDISPEQVKRNLEALKNIRSK